jgi:hypothetical protein
MANIFNRVSEIPTVYPLTCSDNLTTKRQFSIVSHGVRFPADAKDFSSSLCVQTYREKVGILVTYSTDALKSILKLVS